MNNYKVYILLIYIITLSSCQGFLNTRLDANPTLKNLNTDYNTLIQLANAPYGYLQNYNEFSILDGNLFSPVTDESIQTSKTGQVYLFNNGTWNQFNNPNNFYDYYYAGIFTVNYFFNYLQSHGGDYRALLALNRDTITTDSRARYENDVELMSFSIPELHILRAYFYFELSKRYGGVPIVKDIDDPDGGSGITQSSYEDVVSYMVSEIDSYKDALQPNWKNSSFTNKAGRFDKGSALALKSRILLFAASPLHNPTNEISKWEKAAAAAHEAVVFAQGPGGNALDNDYRNYFLGNNMLSSPETILAVRYEANNDLERANYPTATPGGHSGITPSQNLVDAYEYTASPDPDNPYAHRDPRLGYSIVTNGSTWNGRTIIESPGGSDDMDNLNASKTGYYLKKFLNDNMDLINGTTEPRNWPVFRYGELLLEYAEAMNEAYGPDEDHDYGMTAREALNKVRARTGVNMPPILTGGKADFRDAVKHERRIELAFEGYRFWDLLRWKDAETVLNEPILGVQITGNATIGYTYKKVQVQKRVFQAPKMYLFPFPQDEIIKSQGVLKQNPDW